MKNERIPKDRLGFYNSSLRKKESFETFVVNNMPFNYDEVANLSNDMKWKRLTELSVEYLKETGVLPSFAKSQDYERAGVAAYQSYADIMKMGESYDSIGLDDDTQITETFDNVFDNIILPDSYREKIIETVGQLKHSDVIFKEWGLEDVVKRGKGINLLFSGESGTGKTYCGEVIAEYLGFEADLVSVSTLESKWVGESEKNVSDIFRSLGNSKTVLILDEVDSFLLSRSKAAHAHQNKLTNQFLIELERHNGVCVMTTNRPVYLDKALQRRIDLALDFPYPSSSAREKIWEYHIPKKMPTDKLDFEKLASIKLNGGQIKNAVLSAARKTLANGKRVVTMETLLIAAAEEKKESDSIKESKDHS